MYGNNMKRILLINIILSSILIGQIKQLTLEESLELGLRSSKELKISQSKVTASDAKISEVGSMLLPKLSLNASYTRLSEVDPFQVTVPFSPMPIQIQESIFDNYGLQLSLQQPLFTGFKLMSLRKAAKYSFEAQTVEHTKEINETALRIRTAFWSFYKAQKVSELIEENLKALAKHLKNTREFLENGLVTKNDLLKIDVQYSNLKLKKIDAQNNVNLARVNFNKAVGLRLDEPTQIKIDDNFFDVTVYKYDDLLNEALEKREELKALGLKIKAGEENISAAQSGWFPAFYLFGHINYNKPNQRILPLENKFNSTWGVGVSMNWSLWDWGNTKAKTIQAEQQVIQTEEMLKLLKEGVETEVYRNYLKLISEFDKVEVSKKVIESAEENYRITNEKYLQQLATSSDLIDAEVELLNAKTQLATSKVDLELAKTELEKSVGRKIY
jgi:outer membrane protein TolC